MLYGIIFDLLVLGIIVLSVYISAKHGFIRSLIEVVGFILIVLFIIKFSTPIAEKIYTKTVEPAIIDSAKHAITNSTDGTADKLWSIFPKIVTENAQRMGITKELFSKEIFLSCETNIDKLTTLSCSFIAKPVFVKLISTLLSIIAFLLLISLLKFLAKVLNKIFSISIMGTINKSLGGLFGLIKGIVFVMLFCMGVHLFSTLYSGVYSITEKAINNSFIFKYFYEFIPQIFNY